MRSLLLAYQRAYAGLPRDAWILALVALINRSGTMVLPFLTIYLTAQLGLSVAAAGGLVSVYGIGSVVGNAIGGRLTDRFGAVRVQVWSLLATGALFPTLFLAKTEVGIGVGLLALGIIGDAFRPANFACMAAICTPEIRTRGLALNRLAINAGCAIGPVAAGVLAHAGGWAWLFVLDGMTCALAALPLAALRGRGVGVGVGVGVAPAVPGEPPRTSGSPLRDRVFLACIALVAATAILFLQAFSILPLFLERERGLDEATIGVLLAVNPALILVLEMLLVHRVQSYSPLRVVALGAFLCGFGLALLPLHDSTAWTLLGFIVFTFGEMLDAPIMAGFVASRAGEANRGRYLGMYGTAWATAHVAAPFVGSQVYARLGPDALWFGCGAIGTVIAVCYLGVARAVARGKG